MNQSTLPTRSRSTISVQDAVRKIDSMIAAGELVPGQRLVEADLMERLFASRATVRAALQFLAGDGVVELLPNRGGRIKRFEPKRLRDMMQMLVGGIFRVAMELFVSRTLTPEIEAELRERLYAIQGAAAARNVLLLSEAMARYNEFICENSGNAYIQEMLSKVHLRHYARQFVSPEDLSDLAIAAGDYVTITDHLLAGQWEKAHGVLYSSAHRSITRFERATEQK